MIKNVLVISGSYRKGGNSDRLCDQFILGATEAGHTAEKLYLSDMTINNCRGCFSCFSNQGQCIHYDDMDKVFEKAQKADIIVLATPIYYHSMSGQMKTLIDRTFARGRTAFGNKEFYIVISATDSGEDVAEVVLQEFRGFFRFTPGAVEKGVVYGTGARMIGDIEGMPAMEEAYQMGKSISSNSNSTSTNA